MLSVNDGTGEPKANKIEIGVGDLIQVEIDGAYALEKPDRVREIQEHEGRRWVFVETSETGLPMEQTILVEKGKAEASTVTVSAPTPPKLPMKVTPVVPLMSPTEKEWIRGPIGRDVSYRIIVTGDMGPKEIGKLILVLKAQQLALSDEDGNEKGASPAA